MILLISLFSNSFQSFQLVLDFLKFNDEKSLTFTSKILSQAVHIYRTKSIQSLPLLCLSSIELNLPIYSHINTFIASSKHSQYISASFNPYLHLITNNVSKYKFCIKYDDNRGYCLISDSFISTNILLFPYYGEVISSSEILVRENIQRTKKVLYHIHLQYLKFNPLTIPVHL